MEGKVIVVTGASSGIGEAIVHQAAKAGAKVVLVARTKDKLEQVAAQAGGTTHVVVADVTNEAQVRTAAAAAIEAFGHVDVWISNAGVGLTRKPSELTDEDVDEMMRINVKSVMYCVRAMLPHFRARGGGHFIHVSSLLGRLPLASMRSAYCMAKHALEGYSSTLRLELRPENIQVSVMHPGVVATPFGNNALGVPGPDSRDLPMAQSPEEVAQGTLDLVVSRNPDAYSRPVYQSYVSSYFSASPADLGAIESQWK